MRELPKINERVEVTWDDFEPYGQFQATVKAIVKSKQTGIIFVGIKYDPMPIEMLLKIAKDRVSPQLILAPEVSSQYKIIAGECFVQLRSEELVFSKTPGAYWWYSAILVKTIDKQLSFNF